MKTVADQFAATLTAAGVKRRAECGGPSRRRVSAPVVKERRSERR
jgi:hypothetical protein